MSGFDGVAVRVMWVSCFLYLWELKDNVDGVEAFACFFGQAVLWEVPLNTHMRNDTESTKI